MITWNEKKRLRVIRDHGVDFEKIEDLLDDPFLLYFADTGHSLIEERWQLIGKCAEYGLVLVVVTFRDNDVIHFVTARRAEVWMERLYEKQRKRT